MNMFSSPGEGRFVDVEALQPLPVLSAFRDLAEANRNTQARIVATAERLVRETGYEKTMVADIAGILRTKSCKRLSLLRIKARHP